MIFLVYSKHTCKDTLRTFVSDRICLCWVLENELADASLSESNLIVGSDSKICHSYGLITGWVREKERRCWGDGWRFCVSRSLWPAIDIARTELKLAIPFITQGTASLDSWQGSGTEDPSRTIAGYVAMRKIWKQSNTSFATAQSLSRMRRTLGQGLLRTFGFCINL